MQVASQQQTVWVQVLQLLLPGAATAITSFSKAGSSTGTAAGSAGRCWQEGAGEQGAQWLWIHNMLTGGWQSNVATGIGTAGALGSWRSCTLFHRKWVSKPKLWASAHCYILQSRVHQPAVLQRWARSEHPSAHGAWCANLGAHIWVTKLCNAWCAVAEFIRFLQGWQSCLLCSLAALMLLVARTHHGESLDPTCKCGVQFFQQLVNDRVNLLLYRAHCELVAAQDETVALLASKLLLSHMRKAQPGQYRQMLRHVVKYAQASDQPHLLHPTWLMRKFMKTPEMCIAWPTRICDQNIYFVLHGFVLHSTSFVLHGFPLYWMNVPAIELLNEQTGDRVGSMIELIEEAKNNWECEGSQIVKLNRWMSSQLQIKR